MKKDEEITRAGQRLKRVTRKPTEPAEPKPPAASVEPPRAVDAAPPQDPHGRPRTKPAPDELEANPGDDSDRLLGHEEAAAYLGMTERMFRRRLEAGKWDPARVVKGNRVYYSAEGLDQCQREVDSSSAMVSLLNTYRVSLETAHRQLRELFSQTSSTQQQTIDLLLNQRRNDQERIDKLEAKLFEAIEIRERAASEVHVRELQRAQFERAEKRKDEAFAQLKDWGPVLLEQLAGTRLVKRMLEKIDPAKLQALVDPETSFLSEEERAYLKQALEKFAAAKKKEPAKHDTKPDEKEPMANGKSGPASTAEETRPS